MSNPIKVLFGVFLFSFLLVSCDKDDEPSVSNTLKSIKYAPNKMDAKLKTAFSTKGATVSPSKTKVTFKIDKVTKNKKTYKNSIIKIDAKSGKLSAPKDNKLEKGTYVVTVSATNNKNKKNIKKTNFTITVK